MRLPLVLLRGAPPGRWRVPVTLLLLWGRPPGCLPTGRGAVIGLGWTVLRVVATRRVRTVAVDVRTLLGMRGACRGDRLLERRLRYGLRPRLAAFDGKLPRGLDGRLV